MSDYRASPGLNFSSLVHASKSLLHYRYALNTPRTATKAMHLGTLTHALILGDGEPIATLAREGFSVWDDGPRRGKAWASFKAEHEGRVILSGAEAGRCVCMANAVRARIGDMLAGCEIERPLSWRHEETGAALKGRPDAFGPDHLFEVKTTAKIDSFDREVASRYYHAQVGLYAHGILATRGAFPAVTFVVVENAPPFDVAVYDLSEDDVVRGYRIAEDWIRAVVGAEKSGHWPGVAPERRVLDLPLWAMAADDPILPADGAESGEESEEGDGW